MMTHSTHSKRRAWLEAHGWIQHDLPSPHNVRGIGQSVRFEEHGEPLRGLWIALSTGVSLLDGPRDEAMTWEQLVEWVEGKPAGPIPGQKLLFGNNDGEEE